MGQFRSLYLRSLSGQRADTSLLIIACNIACLTEPSIRSLMMLRDLANLNSLSVNLTSYGINNLEM